ncbi:MAG: hypothetical protein OXL41_06350 [Nitrospinae bacterium]|nr:hypothetical protein [Nitrospinota bacterium]
MAMDQNEVGRLIELAVERSFRAVFGDEPKVVTIVNMSERLMALRVDDDEGFFKISLEDER